MPEHQGEDLKVKAISKAGFQYWEVHFRLTSTSGTLPKGTYKTHTVDTQMIASTIVQTLVNHIKLPIKTSVSVFCCFR